MLQVMLIGTEESGRREDNDGDGDGLVKHAATNHICAF